MYVVIVHFFVFLDSAGKPAAGGRPEKIKLPPYLEREITVSLSFFILETNRQVGLVVRSIAVGAEGPGFYPRTGQINPVAPTARHRCDVSSELCVQALSRGDGSRHSLHRCNNASIIKI